MRSDKSLLEPLAAWIESCTTKGEVSRNTVAVGIVVLDHLRRKCPLEPTDVLSARGEVKGARSGLATILERYGIPAKYLKEVTTRAGHQDGQRLFEAYKYGRELAQLSDVERDSFLKSAIASLVVRAKEWLDRQHLKINCDRQLSPDAWIAAILSEARGRSSGKVEQHLVGAKLARRHSDMDILNNPGHAGDAQTGRPGDFLVRSTAYHVTAAPGSSVIEKCRSNLGSGLHPILVTRRDQYEKARHIAEDHGIANRITITAIEDMIGNNIIEMGNEKSQDFIDVLKEIVETYNSRLESVETDMSLKIEVD